MACRALMRVRCASIVGFRGGGSVQARRWAWVVMCDEGYECKRHYTVESNNKQWPRS